ncbi:MAG: UDP-3-O-[3-hydroxymyristoyl] N-acetylglucosamine deacetylase [Limnochordaceae bacterium]|nr:UDP-3-O-[3-hydroxymyristoyl] N-acetylglucosamine deacetylase [Limnochordaceae bacterium]
MQTTLARSVTVEGTGLHTGRPARVKLAPMPPGSGLRLVRTDVSPPAEIEVSVRSRAPVPRCTALASPAARVMTVEHLLSALAGLGIDNVRIEVDGPEIPALDGSAARWVELVDRAGVVEQDAPSRSRRLPEVVWVGDGERFILAAPGEGLRVSFLFTADRPGLQDAFVEFDVTPEVFRREIAPARTVAFLDEVEQLRRHGLGLGGTPDNVVLVGPQGPVTPLRFADEIARHKVLDLIGDLALAGPLQARVVAIRAGHELTARLVSRIWQALRPTEWKG